MANVGALSALMIGLALVATACSSPPPPVVARPRHRSVRTGAVRFPRVTTVGASTAAPAATAEKKPDPEGRRAFLAHLGAAPVPPASGPPPPVTAIGIENTAKGETVGLTPMGPIASAVLAEGQRIELTAPIAPGGCVTWVAQGGLGADEVDLFVTTGQGAARAVIAEDETLGPVAVIGGRKGCFAPPGGAAADATIAVVLRRGGGPVLVRGYQRDAGAAASPEKK